MFHKKSQMRRPSSFVEFWISCLTSPSHSPSFLWFMGESWNNWPHLNSWPHLLCSNPLQNEMNNSKVGSSPQTKAFRGGNGMVCRLSVRETSPGGTVNLGSVLGEGGSIPCLTTSECHVLRERGGQGCDGAGTWGWPRGWYCVTQAAIEDRVQGQTLNSWRTPVASKTHMWTDHHPLAGDS